jgi:hypothetical protein
MQNSLTLARCRHVFFLFFLFFATCATVLTAGPCIEEMYRRILPVCDEDTYSSMYEDTYELVYMHREGCYVSILRVCVCVCVCVEDTSKHIYASMYTLVA